MGKKRLIVLTLGAVAAVTLAGLAALVIPSILYQLRESKLIDTIQVAAPPEEPGAREAAALELGEMRSVRAIPYLIEMWDQPSMKEVTGGRGNARRRDRQVEKEHAAGCEALALIGEPTIPFLAEVLRKVETRVTSTGRPLRATMDEQCLWAVVTCKEMGPTALPLLPELLEWYGRRPSQEVVDAIMAIGEPESMKEVAPWISKKAAREAQFFQRLQQAQPRGGGIPVDEGGTIRIDRLPEEGVQRGILLDHRWHQGREEEKEMPPDETPSKLKT